MGGEESFLNAWETCLYVSGRGAVWLARLNGVQEVAGSNPVAPTLQASLQQPVVARFFYGEVGLPGGGQGIGQGKRLLKRSVRIME